MPNMRPADAYRLKYRASQTIEPSNDESNTPVDSLPDELLARILSPVDLKSLVQARAVCKSWRASVEGKAVSDLRATTTDADFDELDFDDMRPEVVDFVQQRLTNEASGTVFDTALECGLKFMEGSLKFRRFGERLAAQSEGAAAAVVYV